MKGELYHDYSGWPWQWKQLFTKQALNPEAVKS